MFILVFFFSALNCFALDISLSFDDAPMASSALYSGTERTRKINQVLKKHDIQTIFYVNTSKLGLDQGKERINEYSEHGHLIANHTDTHLRLTTNASAFIDEIQKADQAIQEFKTYTKMFRFPYLFEGDDIKNRDAVRNHLKSMGYTNGYVTVDNYDYFINDLVQNAINEGRTVDLSKACEMLTDILVDGVQYYESVAKAQIGDVKHVLLMHENDIEAHCLDKLIVRIKKEGWNIVSPLDSYKDPLLSEEPDTLYLSQGRIAAIAHEKTGVPYRSKWETVQVLTDEFNRRKIVK